MPTPKTPRLAPLGGLSRRSFLGLGAAGAVALALGACGDDGGDDARSDDGSDGGDGAGTAGLALSQLLGPLVLEAATTVRMPFGVIDVDGMLPADALPAELAVTVTGPGEDGPSVEVPVARHDDGVPRPYYPLVFDAGPSGIYTARTEVGGGPAEASFQVHDADELRIVRPGQPLPALETPTVDDHRGVEPICTRDPACGLHDVTVAEALAEGRPLALLVGTPAFCQLAVCGPVLDLLLEAVDDADPIRFLHAEVYVDPYEDLDTTTDAVDGLGLHFEPVLFLADGRGTVVERIDTIYDRAELGSALDRLRGEA